MLETLQANLLSPMVLAFGLGIVAVLLRSDLRFPQEVYDALAIYLLLAIGLKGGAALAVTPLAAIARPALATLALGVGIPLWSYAVLRRLGGLDVANAAAIAAHYGSVSAVTFIAALGYVERLGVPAEGFLPALVAVLEVPAIVVGLLIARLQLGGGSWRELLRELLTGKSVFLLVGGLAIGWLSGPEGMKPVAPLFVDLFRGALTLFLLDMGMVTARRLQDLRGVGPFLLAFGILAPLLHGALGAWLGALSGLSLGGAAVLATMAASASYIAAPAAVRIALPQASPSLYLTTALAVTFPFNLAVGIPLYVGFARFFRGIP
jgi:uncharacterized protein